MFFIAEVEATTCEDINSGCATGVGFGYCTGSVSEISFMKKNCQKSCGFCKSAPKKCEDKQSLAYCYQIKGLNYCTNAKYKAHFQKYCPATCEFCKCKYRYICWICMYRYVCVYIYIYKHIGTFLLLGTKEIHSKDPLVI